MKNIINLSLFRKLYFVNLLTHRIQYPKMSKEFSFKFWILLVFDIFAIQPNFVAWGIAFRLSMLIVIFFLKLLCILEIFSADSYQFSELDY